MTELKIRYSKSGLKKLLACLMAFALILTSLGLGSFTVNAANDGDPVGGELTPGELTPGELGPGEGRYFNVVPWQTEYHVGYAEEITLGINIDYFSGSYFDENLGEWVNDWNDDDWDVQWYQYVDGEHDVLLNGNSDGLLFEYMITATTPYEEYYAVVNLDNGKGKSESLTTERMKVSLDSWNSNVYFKNDVSFVTRGGSITLESPTVDSDIPLDDENLAVSYEWRIYNNEEGREEVVGTEKTLSLSRVYATPEYGQRREYTCNVKLKYGDQEVRDYSVTKCVEISTDGINIEQNSKYEQMIVGGKAVTLSATATVMTSRSISATWYKDGVFYAKVDGTGSKTSPLKAELAVTEPGTYELRVATSRSENGTTFKVYSAADAVDIDSDTIAGEIDADDPEVIGVYKFTPEYSGGVKFTASYIDNVPENCCWGDMFVALYNKNGETVCGNSTGLGCEMNEWFSDTLNTDETYYLLMRVGIPEMDPYAPEEVQNNHGSYSLSFAQDRVCDHYAAQGTLIDGFNNEMVHPEEEWFEGWKEDWMNNNTHIAGYKRATTSADGYTGNCVCNFCGQVLKKGSPIYYAKSLTLASTSLTYSGKAQKPAVTVKDSKGKVISASNYTVAYANNTNVGQATVTVTFKGNYSGKLTAKFSIVPKGTTVRALTAVSKGFNVTLNKNATQTTGYQIQYATASNFSGAKTVTISKNTTLTSSVRNLTGGKKYYVRVRTYRKVGSTNYYSAWSSAKYVTTKK